MINLTPEFWLQSAVYVIGGVCAVIAVAYRIGIMEAKFATKDDLKDKVAERNEKIDRVYNRFDEFKRETHDQFVKKEMCGQMHLQSKDELKRLDEEYKTFRHEIRNTVQKICDKIDEIKERLNGKL